MNAEGRELPHWDMFKRRLWRTPGRWAIAQGLAWLAISLWFPIHWFNQVIPRMPSWKAPSGSELVLCSVMLLGFTLLYYIIANNMSSLADIGGSTGWFHTTLSSFNALNGVLLVTLAQASVTLFGLLAVITTKMVSITSYWSMLESIRAQLGGDIYSFYPFLLLLLLRLPHYALASTCFCIAFRHANFHRLLPLAFTLSAIGMAVFSSKDVYLNWNHLYGHNYDSVAAPLFTHNLTILPIIGVAAIAILSAGLVKLARHPHSNSWNWLLLSPLSLAITGGAGYLTLNVIQAFQYHNPDLEQFFSNPWLQPIHIALTHIYPNSIIAWREYDGLSVSTAEVLGVQVTSYGPWIWPIASYLISLLIWYCATLACLNAARFPTLPWHKLLSR